jgi:hypothetical protein
MEACSMLISDFTVLYCRGCGRFRFEGDDHWFNRGAGLVKRLAARADDLKKKRKPG